MNEWFFLAEPGRVGLPRWPSPGPARETYIQERIQQEQAMRKAGRERK